MRLLECVKAYCAVCEQQTLYRLFDKQYDKNNNYYYLYNCGRCEATYSFKTLLAITHEYVERKKNEVKQRRRGKK